MNTILLLDGDGVGVHVDVVVTATSEMLDLGLGITGVTGAWGRGDDVAVLVDELEIIATEQMGDSRELGSIALCVVI